MLALANCNVSQTSFPTDKYRCIGSVYIYICQKRWQMERTEAWSKGQILAHPPKKLKKNSDSHFNRSSNLHWFDLFGCLFGFWHIMTRLDCKCQIRSARIGNPPRLCALVLWYRCAPPRNRRPSACRPRRCPRQCNHRLSLQWIKSALKIRISCLLHL